MLRGMSNQELTTTSYLVLGLAGLLGRATPYDFKRVVSFSIGHFWTFPHSQLYAEPRRLAELGLLEEEREESGRRRRWYTLTDEGRNELESWLAEPLPEVFELRDLGLLKLFFGNLSTPGDVQQLAQTQMNFCRAHLEGLEALEKQFEGVTGIEYQLATLRMGIQVERLSVQFWKDIAENPPSAQPHEHPTERKRA
jgi:PadR family transcriptional regulator AphA